MIDKTHTRRQLLSALPAVGLGALLPQLTLAQTQLPQRAIPSTGELLPVIGLGSSKGVSEITERGTEPLTQATKPALDGPTERFDAALEGADAVDWHVSSIVVAHPRRAAAARPYPLVHQSGKQKATGSFR